MLVESKSNYTPNLVSAKIYHMHPTHYASYQLADQAISLGGGWGWGWGVGVNAL